jgi:hypothetical protein
LSVSARQPAPPQKKEHALNDTDLTARVLAAAADRLDRSATITHPIGGHQDPVCMNDHIRDLVVRNVHSAIDRVHGADTRSALHNTIPTMLPPATGTITEYANRIRALAA